MGIKERHPKIQGNILRCLFSFGASFRLYLKSLSLFSSLLEKQVAYSSLLLFLHHPGNLYEDLLQTLQCLTILSPILLAQAVLGLIIVL